MTRLWSNPGFEVLAVPGTSRITSMQILHIFFFVFSTSVKVNVLLPPFQEVWVDESQKRFLEQGESRQWGSTRDQQECTFNDTKSTETSRKHTDILIGMEKHQVAQVLML